MKSSRADTNPEITANSAKSYTASAESPRFLARSAASWIAASSPTATMSP